MRIFQFDEISANEWIAVWSPHVAGLAFHPGQGLKQVILADLNISRRRGSNATAEDYIFCGSLQKVVHDLVRSHGIAAETPSDRLGISTRARLAHTVKVSEEGIHNSDMAGRTDPKSPARIVLGV